MLRKGRNRKAERNRRPARWILIALGVVVVAGGTALVFDVEVVTPVWEGARLWIVRNIHGERLLTIESVLVFIGGAATGAVAMFWALRRASFPMQEEGDKLLITQTIWRIIRDNPLETALLVTIALIGFIIVSRVVLAAMQESIRAVPFLLGIGTSGLGLFIGLVGMYYAFHAEDKSHNALKESRRLLRERGEHLDSLALIMGRMNRCIGGASGILREDIQGHNPERVFYVVKAMVLTPFLGHAGLTEGAETDLLYKQFREFKSNIARIASRRYFGAELITLDGMKLVEWYLQIMLIEEMHRRKGDGDAKGFCKEHIGEIYEVARDRVRKRGLQEEFRHDGTGINGFDSLKKEWESTYGEEGRRVEICHTRQIPFQLLLIVKRQLSNRDPMSFAVDQDVGGEVPLETPMSGVITYVGSETYRRLIADAWVHESMDVGGVRDLLEQLHVGLHVHDTRMCEVLNRHFNHYWASESEEIRHYPDVSRSAWEELPETAGDWIDGMSDL